MNKDVKIIEAIERMKRLNLHHSVIGDFKRENKLYLSENFGALYWLNDDQASRVRNFESQHNCVVYHVIHDYTDFGELLTYLYVSDHEDEWKIDRNDLEHGETFAYVENVTNDSCSEFGYVGICPVIGGLYRTY